MKTGKILIVSLAAAFCVFLSACSCTNQEADDPIKDPIPTATATVEPTAEPTETPAPAKADPGSGTTKKPNSGSSTKDNTGSTGSNVNTVTPTPVTPNVDVPESTPTPPRRSSSSNLIVD